MYLAKRLCERGKCQSKKLHLCLELSADKLIPEASVLHDNERIAVRCTDALIAMEAVYQKTCYRDFTRTVTRKELDAKAKII